MRSLHHLGALCLYLGVACLAGPGVRLAAQSSAQSIQGLVTGADGRPVSGARVTIVNPATGASRTAASNDTGNYSFPLVEVGNYDVTCEMQGFQTAVVKGIHVESAAPVRQDFLLQPGEIAETVAVNAVAVSLTTENPTVGGTVENKRIIELPLNGRNIITLASVVPGVQFGIRTGMADGLGGFPIPGQSFSVIANGQRETFQVVSLDGVDAKDPSTHITSFVPSVEALEEFKIQTTVYSAENGFQGGAVVTMTVRSGANDPHGAAFEFLRNDKLDARNYFLAPGAPKDRLRRNQFGVAFSGPIVRNKTFWAFNWEARHENSETVQTAFFPPDSFRSGDFSALTRGTINPATGKLFRPPILISDPLTGDPFPDSRIPASFIHPGARNVINKFLPRADFVQTDPLDFTVQKAVGRPIDANQYFGRLDQIFSDRDRAFGRIAVNRSELDNLFINPSFPVSTPSHVTNLATQWVHTFRQSTINELRFGFNLSDDTLLSLHNRGDFDVDSLGIGQFRVPLDGNRRLTPREQGVPIIQFACQASPCIGERTNGNGFDRMRTYQLSDHVSQILGKHDLKMGVEVYRVQMERAAANLAQGQINFSSLESGYDFASFLMGVPNATFTPEGEPTSFPRTTRVGAYLNDDFRITAKLTFNAGLRYDYIGVPSDSHGLWRTLDFPSAGGEAGRGAGFKAPNGQLVPALFPASVDKGAVKLWKQRVGFFMPRLGFAYRPTPKWVLRLGGGWFDEIQLLNNWTVLNLMPPKSGGLRFDSITDNASALPVSAVDGNTYFVRTRRYRPGAPVLTLDDPFLAGSNASGPVNLLHAPPDTRDGDVWKWSFDIQRQLPMDVAVTVGYVGAKGSHTGNSVPNWNDAPPSPDTDVQSRRPVQRFYDPASPQLGAQTLGNVRYLDSSGNSFYEALQVRIDKRFARGVGFGLAYTYSKAYGDGEAGGNEDAFFQDPRNRGASRGRFSFDQTHALIAHYVWEMPGGRWRRPWGQLFGGWQTNGIVTFRSGFPFTVSEGNDLNTGSNARPDRIADGRLADPTRQLWFDPEAFQRATCNVERRQDLCHYGNAGVNILTSPGQHNFDFSLSKNFPFKERFKLQVRSEFFNALNTPYFGQPNGIGFATNDSIAPNAARMGEIRTLRTPMRIIQFGMKLFF